MPPESTQVPSQVHSAPKFREEVRNRLDQQDQKLDKVLELLEEVPLEVPVDPASLPLRTNEPPSDPDHLQRLDVPPVPDPPMEQDRVLQEAADIAAAELLAQQQLEKERNKPKPLKSHWW